ncbi:MAG: helix-turn-helix transcriptional regulator, partial [Ignavibacteriae bacterium]|nr:helix-turn-helix transcriptional regulator [Ignavibacteriota bacterium]
MPRAIHYYDINTQQLNTLETLEKYTSHLDKDFDSSSIELKPILRYVHAHLFEKTLCVKTIRIACEVRNNNVTTRFRQATGMTICEYVAQRRLEVAACILSSLEVNIYVLAAAVGYTEEAFSKAFRRSYGCSPLWYRKKCSRTNGNALIPPDK